MKRGIFENILLNCQLKQTGICVCGFQGIMKGSISVTNKYKICEKQNEKDQVTRHNRISSRKFVKFETGKDEKQTRK